MSSPTSPSTEPQPARKIALPKTKRNPSNAQYSVPDLGASLQSLNVAEPPSKPSTTKQQAPTETKCPVQPPTNNDEADLAAAWSDFNAIQETRSFEREVKLRRDYFYGELLHLLCKVTTLLRRPPPENGTQKSDPLRRLRPWRLAAAWEKQTWCTAYQVAFDLEPYVDTIAKDIAELQTWIKYWDDCGEGEEMFRGNFHQQFRGQVAELVDDEEIGIPMRDEPLSFASVVAEGEQDVPPMMMSALEIDTKFASEPVVFSAAHKEE